MVQGKLFCRHCSMFPDWNWAAVLPVPCGGVDRDEEQCYQRLKGTKCTCLGYL